MQLLVSNNFQKFALPQHWLDGDLKIIIFWPSCIWASRSQTSFWFYSKFSMECTNWIFKSAQSAELDQPAPNLKKYSYIPWASHSKIQKT